MIYDFLTVRLREYGFGKGKFFLMKDYLPKRKQGIPVNNNFSDQEKIKPVV